MLDKTEALRQLDRAIGKVKLFCEKHRNSRSECEPYAAVKVGALSTISRFSPPTSDYNQQAKSLDKHCPPPVQYPLHSSRWTDHSIAAAGYLLGILIALKNDYSDDCLQSFEELIHANVFADLLEQAEHLLSQGYKDAAAVLIGAVLEGRLKSLCEKNGISVTRGDGGPKKADGINSELAAADVYGKSEMKNITAWLGLRNDAAHGDFGKYDRGQVEILLASVRHFLATHPA